MAISYVDKILNTASMASREDTIGDMLNQLPSLLVEQQQAEQARQDRLQQYADQKEFQNKQLKRQELISQQNIDFNILTSIAGIEDLDAKSEALDAYKSKTADGLAYKNTLIASNDSKNKTIKDFNEDYEVYKKNKNNNTFEQNQDALNKLILSSDSNTTLNVFSNQLEKEKQMLRNNETKYRIGLFADGFTLQGATEEQNKKLRASLKQAPDWQTAKNIIEISSSQLKKPLTMDDYNLLLDNIREGVEENLISPEEGERMTSDIYMKINEEIFVDDNNKNKDSKIPKDVTFVKEREVDGIKYNLYKKTENGQNKYYFIENSGFGERTLQEMSEAEFKAAMGIVEEKQKDVSQSGFRGQTLDSPLNPNNPLSGVNTSISLAPGITVSG